MADNELLCWADWAGDLNRAAVRPEARRTLRWALDVVRDFYGDEWFAKHAARRLLPLMSPYDWPLSNGNAVVRLLERAARIAVVPDDVQRCLVDGKNGIRASNDISLFHHLDVVLEVIGLALREGWTVVAEREARDGRCPDLHLTRGTIGYTVEITRRGHDQVFRQADRQMARLTEQRLAVEMACDVECSTKVHRKLSDDEFDGFADAMQSAAARTAKTGTNSEVNLGFASAAVYPSGQRPAHLSVSEGPELAHDLWPTFGRRLHEKAQRTASAGPTWLRVDEVGGLLIFTPAARMPIDSQLSLLCHNVREELSDYHHVLGVVMSHGAESDPDTQRPEQSVHHPATPAWAMNRRLPGRRRRRTFVIPVNAFSGLALPDHLVLQPGRWYDSEGGWLDWALNRLGHPSVTSLVPGEGQLIR